LKKRSEIIYKENFCAAKRLTGRDFYANLNRNYLRLYENDMNEYRKKLKKNGFKITPKREAIIAFFSRKNRYATPETVWKEVKKSLPQLGLPTVYRNLEQMRKIGILTQVEGTENRFYFGLCRAKNPGEHHHHISCQKCHRVSEVESCYLDLLTKEVKKKTGFLIIDHKLQLTGICRNCRGN